MLQTLPTDGALLVFLVALGLVIGSRTWDRGLSVRLRSAWQQNDHDDRHA